MSLLTLLRHLTFKRKEHPSPILQVSHGTVQNLTVIHPVTLLNKSHRVIALYLFSQIELLVHIPPSWHNNKENKTIKIWPVRTYSDVSALLWQFLLYVLTSCESTAQLKLWYVVQQNELQNCAAVISRSAMDRVGYDWRLQLASWCVCIQIHCNSTHK
jgi:hypothetical protein